MKYNALYVKYKVCIIDLQKYYSILDYTYLLLLKTAYGYVDFVLIVGLFRIQLM
jgi:hypothetical protein